MGGLFVDIHEMAFTIASCGMLDDGTSARINCRLTVWARCQQNSRSNCIFTSWYYDNTSAKFTTKSQIFVISLRKLFLDNKLCNHIKYADVKLRQTEPM